MSYSTPIADDLALYLGAPPFADPLRANLFIALAETRCLSIVSPLPDGAEMVVIPVAGRAFSNPEGVTAETVGPYSVQRTPGSIYLTRDDKATLRRLAGGSSAFSIDSLPTGVSAVQMVTVLGSPTGGTFRLSFAGQQTAPLAFNASSADVQAALDALGALGVGNSAVSGAGPYTISFVSDLATTPVPTFIADGSGLSGGTDPSVTVVVVTAGVLKPGQGLPSWDFDFFSQPTIGQIV